MSHRYDGNGMTVLDIALHCLLVGLPVAMLAVALLSI
jgi:hypothetical protein